MEVNESVINLNTVFRTLMRINNYLQIQVKDLLLFYNQQNSVQATSNSVFLSSNGVPGRALVFV